MLGDLKIFDGEFGGILSVSQPLTISFLMKLVYQRNEFFSFWKISYIGVWSSLLSIPEKR